MKTTTAEAVIRTLRHIFTSHGFPDTVVSDNGPQFTASEFEEYLAGLGVKHSLIPPFNPSSNGQAERAVRTTKEALGRLGTGDWQEKIDTFLLAQHITPSAESGKSPAELLMGRKLRSKMDRLHPRFTAREEEERAPVRTIGLHARVFARDYRGGQKWAPGRVHEIRGPKTYVIDMGNGNYWHRHINQLRKREAPNADWLACEERGRTGNDVVILPTVPPRIEEERLAPELGRVPGDPTTVVTEREEPNPSQQQPERERAMQATRPANNNEGILRRSSREASRPAYLNDYVC